MSTLPKGLIPTLAAVFAVLATPPALSSQTGSTLTFGDWAAVCDNGWRCEALMANPEATLNSSLSIHIVRDGGADGQLQLAIYPGASMPDGKGFLPRRFQVSGGGIEIATSLPTPTDYDGDAVTFEGDAAASLLRTMAKGDSFAISEQSGRSVTLSTSGLLAVLAYFDTVQQRIGNESALAASGSAPKASIPQPPQLPLIKVPETSAKPPRTLSKVRVLNERRKYPCGKNERFAKTTSGVEYARLDERTTLALIMPLCPLSNYNSFHRVLLVEKDGNARLAPIERDNPDAMLAEALPGAYWDEERRRLVSFGRWNGSCGSGEDYVWDGEVFRVAEERATASCELEIFRTLTTWRAKVTTSEAQAEGRNDANKQKLDKAFLLFSNEENERALAIANEVVAEFDNNRKNVGKTYFCADDATERSALLALAWHNKQDAEIVDGSLCFALTIKGWVLQEMNRTHEADNALTRAIEMTPLDLGDDKRYAAWLYHRGEWQRSIDLFRKAVSVAEFVPPKKRSHFHARALRGIGFGLVSLGKLDEAEASYRESLKLSPDNPAALAELEYIKQVREKGAAP